MNFRTPSIFSKIPILLLMALLLSASVVIAQNCEDFNNGLGNWSNGGSASTVVIGTSNPTIDGSPYLNAFDLAGGSWATAPYRDSRGDLTCMQICFDYKVFNDGWPGDVPVAPRFTIYSGTSITNATFRATFIAPFVSENDRWGEICVNLSGDTPPANWNMDVGTPADWPILISNINGFGFTTDVAIGNTADEEIGVDNFCIQDIPVNGCEDFDNGLAGWSNGGTLAIVGIGTANPTDDGSPYLEASDLAGTSVATTAAECPMDLSCSQVCFDYKIFNDGWPGDTPVNLRFSIYSGGTITNPTFNATFVGPALSENDPWGNFCISFSGTTPPDDWVLGNNTTPADWSTLISNIDGFGFSTDVAVGNTADEVIGVDNFCIEDLSLEGCADFDTGTDGWSNGGTFATVGTSTTAPLSDGTSYLEASDLSGTSWATVGDTLCGSFDLTCAEICFDYKIFNDGWPGDVPVNMVFRIYSGESITNPTLFATFTGPSISEGDMWLQDFCLNLTSGEFPPNGWTMGGSAVPTDWPTLISNINGFGFTTDVAVGNTADEVIGIDNFCITEGEAPCGFQVDCFFEKNYFCILDAEGNPPTTIQWISPVFPNPTGYCQATTGLAIGDLLVFVVDGVEYTLVYDCGPCECKYIENVSTKYPPCITPGTPYCVSLSFDFAGADGTEVNFYVDQLNSTPGFTLITPLPLIANNGSNTFELCFDYTGECLKDIQLFFDGEVCDGNGSEECKIWEMIMGLYCCDGEIPSCKNGDAPTNLDIVNGMFTWDAVAGASYYNVVVQFGGKMICDCPVEAPPGVSILFQTSTNSLDLPDGYEERCFQWTVTAVCEEGKAVTSDPACHYPTKGDSRDSNASNETRPQVLALDDIRVYPNPAAQQLNFAIHQSTFNDHHFNVQLINTAGQVVRYQDFAKDTHLGQLQIGDLANGYYLLRLTNAQGAIQFRKVIIANN